MWINHFVSFEQKRNRKNDLMLGFYHSSGRGVKVFVDYPVRVPTRFIHIGSGELDDAIAKIRGDDMLSRFALDLHCATNANQTEYRKRGVSIWPGIRNFHVLAITMPNDKTLEERLDKLAPKMFQLGNYDAMLKLRGFYPCRKVVFDEKMEEALIINNKHGGKRAREIEDLLKGFDERNKFEQSSENNRYETRLASLSGIKFLDEFLTREEFEAMRHLYFDTEQPLYQTNEQQALVERHKKLVRILKKHEKVSIEKRDEEHWHKTLELCSQIDESEARLVEKCPGFDDFHLWSEEFAPRITSICAIWENANLRRLYWWDPHGEFKRDNVRGFNVINEQDNKRMLQRFRDDAREICAFDMTAHNASYDNRTLRQMMMEYGDMFDPGLEGVQIKRDLVLGDLFQRLSERAVVHLDTLWLARTFFPWLNQRSLGTSFKLEGVAKQCKVNFKKSMSHEELRRTEIDRLFNPFDELRAKASDDISNYAVNDLPPLPEIIKAMDARGFLCLMKNILPYCTYSELVFSPNCARKSHTRRHFVNSGNLPNIGFQNVWRMDELWEFKRDFPKLKRQMLQYVGIEIPSKVKGEHKNVREIYLPLEEWTREMLFRISPRFKIGYERTENNQMWRIAYLQYLKAFAIDVFADYYFARQEAKRAGESRENYGEEFKQDFKRVYRDIFQREWDELCNMFGTLQKSYRRFNVALANNDELPKEAKQLVREIKQREDNIGIFSYLKPELEMYLVERHASEILDAVSNPRFEGHARRLRRFCNSFDRFDKKWAELAEHVEGKAKDPYALIYTYMRGMRSRRLGKIFFGRYGYDIDLLKTSILNGYRRLSSNLDAASARTVDRKGDYLFITADKDIPETYKVGEFDIYPPNKIDDISQD